jgi:hypothetical protein
MSQVLCVCVCVCMRVWYYGTKTKSRTGNGRDGKTTPTERGETEAKKGGRVERG